MKRKIEMLVCVLLVLVYLPCAGLAENVPMGRYVERSLGYSGDGYRVLARQGSVTYMTSADGSSVDVLSADLQSWETRSIGHDEEKYPLKGDMRGFAAAPDGGCYILQWLIGEHSTGISARILRVKDGEESIFGPDMGEHEVPVFSGLDVLPNGDVMLLDRDQGVLRFAPDGSLISRYLMAGGESFAVSDEELAIYSYDQAMIAVFNLASASQLRELALPESGAFGHIAYDSSGNLYMAATPGIYRMNVGGTLWEQLVEGALTTLSKPTANLFGIVFDADDDPVLVFYENGAYNLVAYRYDATIPTEPIEQINVFSLYENKTLRQAIADYQTHNPISMVNVTVALPEGTAITRDDAIRTLNTEILAGRGPDVIVLDDLPVDSYIGKGVLADLSDIVDPMIEGGLLHKAIANTYERDGALPAVPARFAVPMLWGDVDGMSTLSDVAAYVKAHPDTLPLYRFEADYLVNTFFLSCAPSWVGEDGRISEERLAEFLTCLKEIRGDWTYDATIPILGIDLKAMGVSISAGPPYSDTRGLGGMDEFSAAGFVFEKKVALFPYLIQGTDSMAVPFGAIERIEGASVILTPGQSDNVYMPACIMSVNAMSPALDAAKRFVASVLSEAVQDTDLTDGFPVHLRALDNAFARDEALFGIISSGTISGEMFSSAFPDAKTRAHVRPLIDALDTPSLPDVTLYQMVLEQAIPCLDGDISPEQAAANVAGKANAYLSE